MRFWMSATLMHKYGRRKDFSRGGEIMDFSSLNQNIFSRGATRVKFYFTNSKLRKKRFSPKKLIGKYQFKKSRGPRPPATRRPCAHSFYIYSFLCRWRRSFWTSRWRQVVHVMWWRVPFIVDCVQPPPSGSQTIVEVPLCSSKAETTPWVFFSKLTATGRGENRKKLEFLTHFFVQITFFVRSTVHGKKSFLSKESYTLRSYGAYISPTTVGIISYYSRHHQLLFK